MLVEATCQDLKSRGLGLEDGRLRSAAALERLLLALVLGCWLLWLLGTRALRRGQASRAGGRVGRLRLARHWLRQALDHCHLPPFPLVLGPNGPRLRWVL